MKIHFGFFLSHVNSEKYKYFIKNFMYFEKIPREKHPEASCFTRRHNAPSYDVIGKEAPKLVQKVLCNVCLIGKFMKWLYERANHVIEKIWNSSNIQKKTKL